MPEITATFKIVLIGVMTITGAINTLAYKFQNKQMVYEGAYYKYFFHPYMQCVTMFVGQAFSLLIFHIMKRKDPEGFRARMLEARNKGKEIKMNKMLLVIPAIGDFFTSTLVYASLNFIPGSVYQMLRGGAIATTFMFSVIFLKAKILRHQVAGSILALLGITIVGGSNLIFSDSDSGADASMQVIGYALVVGSLFFNGFYFVYEQKLLSKYHLEPLEVVGWEGVFGLCIYAVMLPIFTFLPCTFGKDACVFTLESYPFWESPEQYFMEAFSSWPLLLFCILGIFSIAAFNITGVTITKYINALARSVADVSRTIIVWIVGIIITMTAGANYPNYSWELVNGYAISVQLLGFIVLVFGNLVYNEIVKIPWVYQAPIQEPLLDGEGDEDTDDAINRNRDLDISLQKKEHSDGSDDDE